MGVKRASICETVVQMYCLKVHFGFKLQSAECSENVSFKEELRVSRRAMLQSSRDYRLDF